MAQNSDITTLINDLRNASATGSVTPAVEAAIMERLNAAIGAVADSVTAYAAKVDPVLTRFGRILNSPDSPGNVPVLNPDGQILYKQIQRLGRDKVPEDVIYSNTLPYEWLQRIWDILVSFDKNYYPFLGNDLKYTHLRNGYYAGNMMITSSGYEYEAPYVLYGVPLSVTQAIAVIFDRWIPGTGGVQMKVPVNIPMGLKDTDSNIDMSYTCCNNYDPVAIALTRTGWEQGVVPTTLHRAFDNCQQLTTITGVISLQRIASQYDVMYAFRQCPKLRHFIIKNVADTVTDLDLSGVAQGISSNWSWMEADGTSHTVCTLLHLIQNIGKRSQPLTLHLPAYDVQRALNPSNPFINAISKAPCQITITT